NTGMDTLPNDVFATIYSEGEGAGGWSPFPQNSIHPFDTSSLTPTTSEISSSSSMDLSSPNQDIFRTPSSELTPSPLDLTSCDEDLFSRQLLSTVLNPATTLHPMKTCTSSLLGSIPQQKSPKLELGLFDLCSQSFADLILAPSSMVVATTIENATVHSNISAPTMKRREATAIPLLFSTSPSVAPTTTMTTTTTTMTTAATATASIPSSIPCSTLSSLSLSPVFCSSSSQDVEMIEVKIEPIKDTPRAKKINADREKPITEKRLTKMPGIAKRHSVSRQAQQPPLVTHQHHTPPPFVSPLIQRPHHQQQHYHQKSGSLDLRRANLNCFIQPQRQVEPSAQHEHIPSVGLLTMHLQDSTSTSLGADTLSSTPVGKQSPSDLCQSRLHQIPQSPSKQQQQQLLPHQQHQSSQQEALESLELQLRQQQRQHHRQQQGQLQQLQLHQREQRQTSMLFGSGATNTTGGSQRMSSMLKRRLTRDKLIKNDREEVWPADVERVFYEEGERVLKQIIREREAQLLDLAEKLTGHKQSLSFSSSPSSSLSSLPLDFNYPELLRLSKAKMTDRASTPFDSVDEQFQEGDDGSKPMPGVFPVEVADGSSSHIPIQVQVQNYQCSYISILFWAASLIAVNLLP
ncbi:hypothetical protein BX616_002388, partial [Lobosporangium transversale]